MESANLGRGQMVPGETHNGDHINFEAAPNASRLLAQTPEGMLFQYVELEPVFGGGADAG
jgi:hypothetical protein